MSSPRSSTLDIIKGILIIFVIIGHVIRGKLDETFLRFFIYQFHMPIFFFTSGLLLTSIKIDKLNINNIFRKYCLRLGLPWSVAVIVYFIASECSNGNFSSLISIKNILMAFIIPYYHLWFIPALIFYIFIVFALTKLFKDNIYIVPILIIGLSVFGKILNVYHENYKFIKLFDKDFRIYNILFFYLGIYFNDYKISISKKYFFFSLLFLLIPVMYETQNTLLYQIFWYILNIGFCIALYSFIKFYPNIKSNVLYIQIHFTKQKTRTFSRVF